MDSIHESQSRTPTTHMSTHRKAPFRSSFSPASNLAAVLCPRLLPPGLPVGDCEVLCAQGAHVFKVLQRASQYLVVLAQVSADLLLRNPLAVNQVVHNDHPKARGVNLRANTGARSGLAEVRELGCAVLWKPLGWTLGRSKALGSASRLLTDVPVKLPLAARVCTVLRGSAADLGHTGLGHIIVCIHVVCGRAALWVEGPYHHPQELLERPEVPLLWLLVSHTVCVRG